MFLSVRSDSITARSSRSSAEHRPRAAAGTRAPARGPSTLGPMAPSRFAIPAALVAIATALIVLLAIVMLRHLPAHVRRASPRQLRSGLALEMVGAALLLLGAPAAALQFAHGAGHAASASRLTPIEPSLWPVVAAPVAIASIALGLTSLRGRVPRVHAPLTVGSALVAGALLLLLSLAGRMVVADALLIGLMIPAWAWLMGEIAPRTSAAPEAGGADHGLDLASSRGPNPGPHALVLCLGLASILGALALRPEWSPAVHGLTLSALGALLIPLALASTQAGVDPERAVHAGAPVFLIATIPPLGALGIATLARIWLVVDGAAVCAA